MKLLIKIYLENTNPYDVMGLIKDLINNIIDKDNTKIYLMMDNPNYETDLCDFYYLNDVNIVKMINFNLDKLEWDIVLPIFRTCIPTKKGFDLIIKQNYQKNFVDLNGVLWLNDGAQTQYNTFPVIGRNYYNKFGYIYNPIYNKKNFEREFTDVMKLINKFYFVNDILFKVINFKLDDDNIYEFRKRINFGLI